ALFQGQAAERQHLQLGHAFELVEPGAGYFGVAQNEGFEGQVFQLGEARVRDLGVKQVQLLQVRERLERGQVGVLDVGAAEVQAEDRNALLRGVRLDLLVLHVPLSVKFFFRLVFGFDAILRRTVLGRTVLLFLRVFRCGGRRRRRGRRRRTTPTRTA